MNAKLETFDLEFEHMHWFLRNFVLNDFVLLVIAIELRAYCFGLDCFAFLMVKNCVFVVFVDMLLSYCG